MIFVFRKKQFMSDAVERILQLVCCIKAPSKGWAEGEDDGDARYEPVEPSGTKFADKFICVPQKIDPKTFFANERTFLKWLSISVMVGMMSLTLLNFADTNSDGAELAGLVLLPVSVAFMLYALYVFRFRAHCIYMREPMRYDDTKGPTVLVTVLVISLILSTMFTLQKRTSKATVTFPANKVS